MRGGEHERVVSPLVRGGSGHLPLENFDKFVPLNAF